MAHVNMIAVLPSEFTILWVQVGPGRAWLALLPRDPTWRTTALCGPARLCKLFSAWPVPQRHHPGPMMPPCPAALRPENTLPQGTPPTHKELRLRHTEGPTALPVRAAGPPLRPTRPGWAAVSGGADGFGHRQPHGPPEPTWGLTRTRALESHQDLSTSAALAPQGPTLPPCSGRPVAPGIPWA